MNCYRPAQGFAVVRSSGQRGPRRFASPKARLARTSVKKTRIFMKLAITRFVIVAAIAVLMVAVGSTAAWAQTPCPSSPNYTPDFSANQSCLTSNDNAILPFSFDNSNVLQLTSGTSNQVG